MSDTAWKEGAPRSVGAGREREGKNTSYAILGDDWHRRKGRGDPRRFSAALFAGLMRDAGHPGIAADVERAFGLRRPIETPTCRCYRGLETAQVECQACRRYRMGWAS